MRLNKMIQWYCFKFGNLPQNQKTLNCNIALREKLKKKKTFFMATTLFTIDILKPNWVRHDNL